MRRKIWNIDKYRFPDVWSGPVILIGVRLCWSIGTVGCFLWRGVWDGCGGGGWDKSLRGFCPCCIGWRVVFFFSFISTRIDGWMGVNGAVEEFKLGVILNWLGVLGRTRRVVVDGCSPISGDGERKCTWDVTSSVLSIWSWTGE
jgi:hypothetical protein